MFSEECKRYARKAYQERMALFGERRGEITEGLARLEAEGKQEQALLMRLLYGTMPLCDVGDYEFGVFLSYVEHGLWLREHISWCRHLREDFFLHYVLYYRINTEAITGCRAFFHEQLEERVRGKELSEAVLAVNYWCAEQAGYAASDERTLSPMAVYRSGSGRCGEESTFVVSALRSVGIPARQVYAPWWAHCDDNHAWVEVYLEDGWHFLGACEPEEALDRGWFVGAASRAVLVHSRTFFDYWLPEGPGEECIGREGSVWYYNSTARYVQRTRGLVIWVKDRRGMPVSHGTVCVEVLNMAECRQAARLLTDERGRAFLTVGFGDLRIHAAKDGWFGQVECLKAGREQVCIILDRQGFVTEEQQSFMAEEQQSFVEGNQQGFGSKDREMVRWEVHWEAPKASNWNRRVLSREKRELGRKRRQQAEERRAARVAGFYDSHRAGDFPGEQEILALARGNFQEICDFLSADSNPDRSALLHSLSAKDYRDVKAAVLEAFLGREPGSDRERYVSYVLCPRIGNEELTPYPAGLRSRFTREQREDFRKDPFRLWDYIQSKLREDEEETYPALTGTPEGCLRLGRGTALEKRTLFVAVCRSLGIPARLEPRDREAQFWQEGEFRDVSGQRDAARGILNLEAREETRWIYGQTWSISRREGECFVPLHYEGTAFCGGELTLKLKEGEYRLITTSRLPNGNQHAVVRVFFHPAQETRKLVLSMEEEAPADLCCCNELEDFQMKGAEGGAWMLSELVEDGSILAFLEVGQEPTEHVLNEMLSQAALLASLPVQILFVLEAEKDLKHPTLQAVQAALPKIRVFLDEGFGHAENLAREMYVEPEKLPLLVVTRQGLTGVYGCSGYHVGSVELMTKIIKLKV